MNRIAERLFIGDANDGADADALRGSGITAVLNATNESDRLGGRFAYLRLGQDDGAPIPPERLDRFARWMRERMETGETVLIHCGAGVSRAATFAITWLMLAGLSWDEAEALVLAARPQIAPNAALKLSVQGWFAERGQEAARREAKRRDLGDSLAEATVWAEESGAFSPAAQRAMQRTVGALRAAIQEIGWPTA